MNHTWENSEKLKFGLDFRPFCPEFFSWGLLLLDVRQCRKLSSYAILKKSYDPNSRKWRKATFWPQFRPSSFSQKIWLRQSLDIMVSYHHAQYLKKLMIHSWENLVMDGRTDRHPEKRTRVISWNAVRLTSSVQQRNKKYENFDPH